MYMSSRNEGLQGHNTCGNITKDGTQTVWMASMPDGTREVHNETSDGSVCVAFNIAVDLA